MWCHTEDQTTKLPQLPYLVQYIPYSSLDWVFVGKPTAMSCMPCGSKPDEIYQQQLTELGGSLVNNPESKWPN